MRTLFFHLNYCEANIQTFLDEIFIDSPLLLIIKLKIMSEISIENITRFKFVG